MPSGSAENLTVTAYRTLRAAIISCRLRPGEKLVISELCKSLGVSLGAVREALSRLASEGLVIAEPQKGFRVAPISQAELEDLTSTRGIIEGHCIERAIAVGELISVEEVALPYRFTVTWRRLGVEAGRSMHVLVAGGVVLIKAGAINFYASGSSTNGPIVFTTDGVRVSNP